MTTLRRVTLALVLTGAGCFQPAVVPDPKTVPPKPPSSQQMSSVDLQRAQGWSVGADPTTLTHASAINTDVDGSMRWQAVAPVLVDAMAPPPALQPYYVPTLFESVTGDKGAPLRGQMLPMFDAAMKDALQRSTCLESLLAQAAWPKDLAVIVDLPGPESVAVAAKLAEHYAPVFDFDGWPHPDGVVASQDTLAATLYYVPMFERARAKRAVDAPPMFVLDENRLTPYEDETQFDNRYFAQVPSVAQLKALGIAHVLYVNHDGEAELDDLNQQLWGYLDNGVDVRMLAMSDFSESGEPPSEEEQATAEDPSDLWVELDPGVFFYWGGTPWAHRDFWSLLGWSYGKRANRHGETPVGSLGMRQLPIQHTIPDLHVSAATEWRPSVRPTVYDAKRSNPGVLPKHQIGWVNVKYQPHTQKVASMRPVFVGGPRSHGHAPHGDSSIAHLVSGSAARTSSASHGGAREVGGGSWGSRGSHSTGSRSSGSHSSGSSHSSGGHSSGGHSGGGHH